MGYLLYARVAARRMQQKSGSNSLRSLALASRARPVPKTKTKNASVSRQQFEPGTSADTRRALAEHQLAARRSLFLFFSLSSAQNGERVAPATREPWERLPHVHLLTLERRRRRAPPVHVGPLTTFFFPCRARRLSARTRARATQWPRRSLVARAPARSSLTTSSEGHTQKKTGRWRRTGPRRLHR